MCSAKSHIFAMVEKVARVGAPSTTSIMVGSVLGIDAADLLVRALFTRVTAHFYTVHTCDPMELSVCEDSRETPSDLIRILIGVELLHRDINNELILLLLWYGPRVSR